MEEWQASVSQLVPFRRPREEQPETLCQASPILGCAWSSFPSKILFVGNRRQLQHGHPGIQEEEEPESQRPGSPRASLLFIRGAQEAFSAANRVLGCLPWPGKPLPRPLLVPPSALIRSLYQCQAFHPADTQAGRSASGGSVSSGEENNRTTFAK